MSVEILSSPHESAAAFSSCGSSVHVAHSKDKEWLNQLREPIVPTLRKLLRLWASCHVLAWIKLQPPDSALTACNCPIRNPGGAAKDPAEVDGVRILLATILYVSSQSKGRHFSCAGAIKAFARGSSQCETSRRVAYRCVRRYVLRSSLVVPAADWRAELLGGNHRSKSGQR